MGWVVLSIGMGAPILLWWFHGEQFLAANQRQPAEVLVVEGWIGIDGIRAAKTEFERGGYRLLVAAGGLSENRWSSQRWNLATEAYELLLREGVPAEKLIEAPTRDTESQRTFESALAVRRALKKHGIHPAGVNVFTFGVHTRRSRLILSKVLGPATTVGAISWGPAGYAVGPWWQSTERADWLIKETVGFLFELLLNSGRLTNSPTNQNLE